MAGICFSMFATRSQCQPRPALHQSLRRHQPRPTDARRRRWVRRAVPPSVLVPDVTTVSSAAPPDTQPLFVFLAGGIGIALLIGLGFSSQLQGRGSVISIPPSKLKALLESKEAVFLDIRSRLSIKEIGNPSFKGLAARQKTLPFLKRTKEGDLPDPKFGETFAKTKGLNSDSIVVLMDADGKSADQAARDILNFNDLKEVYVISGGATGLKSSGWEWKTPTEPKPLTLPKIPKVSVPKVAIPKVAVKGLDLDKVAETYKQRPTLFNTGLAVGAIATAGVILFNEFDVILETVGLLGGVNVLFKRFFYAEDREKTIKDLKLLFKDKIAPSEAGDDLKRLASTILESAPAQMEEKSTPLPSPPAESLEDQVVDTF